MKVITERGWRQLRGNALGYLERVNEFTYKQLVYAFIGKSVRVRELRCKMLPARGVIPETSGAKKNLGSEKSKFPYRKPTLVGE